MSLVRFEKIQKLAPGQVTSINPAYGQGPPLSPVTSPTDARTQLYDPTWGYFVFGQSLQLTYGEDRAYQDVGIFTIDGVFTIDAFYGIFPTVPNSDEGYFNALVGKYTALETLFKNKANASAPNLFNWGTLFDPRCIALPEPLRDKNNSKIFALPVSLEVMPGQWGKEIRYRAILHECKPPQGKILINGQSMDRGIISFMMPKPILQRTRMAGCAGEVIQVQNYTTMQVQITAQAQKVGPFTALHIMPEIALLLHQLESGIVDIGVQRFDADTGEATDVILNDVDVDTGTGIDVAFEEQTNTLTISAKKKGF